MFQNTSVSAVQILRPGNQGNTGQPGADVGQKSAIQDLNQNPGRRIGPTSLAGMPGTHRVPGTPDAAPVRPTTLAPSAPAPPTHPSALGAPDGGMPGAPRTLVSRPAPSVIAGRLAKTVVIATKVAQHMASTAASTPTSAAPTDARSASLAATGTIGSLPEAPVSTAPPNDVLGDPSVLGAPRAEDAPDEPALTLEGLLDAWGSSDERYDLNGDGIVNMPDLLSLLERVAEGRTTSKVGSADPPPPPPAPPAGETTSQGSDFPVADAITVDGLRAAWGSDDTRYDLNDDGIVNMRDLVMLLARMSREGGDEAPAPDSTIGLDRTPMSRPHPALDALRDPNLRGVADSLGRTLKNEGFVDRPPADIHDLVSHLQLGTFQRQALMHHLHAQFPEGLGLNVVG